MSCKMDREETLGLVKPPLYIHTYHLYSRRKRSLEREWDCFPCLGPSHLEGSYLRFHLPEIFREGCLLLPGAAGAVCRAPISPHLSCCRHCFCCLCLLSLPVCVPRGSASMSASLSASVDSAQKVRSFPLGGIPGTGAFISLFCFALHSGTCLHTKTPQDCGNNMPCARGTLHSPGCSEGKIGAEPTPRR